MKLSQAAVNAAPFVPSGQAASPARQQPGISAAARPFVPRGLAAAGGLKWYLPLLHLVCLLTESLMVAQLVVCATSRPRHSGQPLGASPA